ncbi:AAA family ATPase [Paraburkholderia fungorum]|uniref:AAA family ATPase n=1 Tax=Paraburkholderia fungorum TaxID=134537 RepID=UPI00402BA237
MNVSDFSTRCGAVLETLSREIVGKEVVLRELLAGLLANGHILIEDNPGLAKTLIARLAAQALGLEFKRIQFTPDLLPGDVTGSSIYDARTGQFEFRGGPIFTHLLLADEINRATPKTQSAMLEAMQERQVTNEGLSHPLGPPFLVIATQNPIEFEGTYALPEAQLDRFIMRVAVGYPERDAESEILRRRRERRVDAMNVSPVLTRAEFITLQEMLETVHVDSTVSDYIVDLARASRTDTRIAVGASPRGSLALQSLARAVAALDGRTYVTPDDVKAMAVPALSHRLVPRPELWLSGISTEQVIRDVLDRVPSPGVRP